MSIVSLNQAASGRSLLIRGGGVISMDPYIGDLASGDVHIRDGVIVDVGQYLDVPDADIIDATSMVVMPGFVDGHRHLWEGIIRNSLPNGDLGDYGRVVLGACAPALEPDDAYLGTLVSALGALDAGVTTVLDWAHIQTTPDHTAATIAALRESSIRAVFAFGPPGAQDRGHAYPQDVLRLRQDEFASTDQLLTLGLATISPEHAPDEVARPNFELARETDLLVSAHAGVAGFGEPNQIERYGAEGLLGPQVNLVHCNTLTETEWKIIADTGTTVSITPSAEMQMGHGVPPIQPAVDAGVTPSLGVDVETSAPGDMWTQMRLIFGIQRSNALQLLHSGKSAPALINVDDVLRYATIGGATATRLQDKVGTLAPGKQADLILLRADMINVLPVNDLRSAVVHNMDARNVDTVIVAGRVVKRDGSLLGVDMTRLASEIHSSRERVFTRAGQPYFAVAPRAQGAV
jgi:5-methylthioadenosine/S-adenosylhomocysteine deaminase